ncbi:carbohydrate ABC transporter permease [Microlunatus flavus]|uniref:Multiple sugar transport system permease protein n=1 Tax=Microlunatus flavus TaxID=1036181 RepID=A0A1H9AMC0_9ACTN|nr:sugar ABC transporter permease [Microlunatus flavus]SEP77705.1 multiple sugar transport system permease protein [Microlunatus flavus]
MATSTTAPAAVAPPVREPRSRTRRGTRSNPLGWIFSAPYLVFIAVVFAYPLGFAVYMSFHDYFFTAPGVTVPKPFIGLENYTAALVDPAVRQSFVNVAVFLVINVPLTVVVSLVLASLLDRVAHARAFLRVTFYLPYLTSSVAIVGVWLFLFSSGGIVNRVLGPLAPDPSWLVNERWAMPSIALFVTWKGLGFYILLYLAGLQNVSKDLYEAAATDGASRWQSFVNVTVPALRPATVLVLILSIITGANLFTEPYLLTGGGGPNGASSSPVLVMYQNGIQQGQPGYAAAIGVLLVIGTLILSYLSNRFAGGRDR